MKPAFVVNGVVVSDDGTIVSYRTRCPRCGYVDMATLYSRGCGEGVIVSAGKVACVKCSNADHRSYYFDIQLRRG